MNIQKTSIRSIERYTDHIRANTQLRIIARLSSNADAVLQRAGFELPATAGTTILPTARGTATRRNAEGWYIVHRDQPKERRYTHTCTWTYTDWHGNDHTGEHDIYRSCYPRTQVAPTGIELTYMEVDDEALLVSPVFEKRPEDIGNIKAAINVLLELNRSCEIVDRGLADIPMPVREQVRWKFLPPGDHPWERIEATVRDATRGRPAHARRALMERQQNIHAQGPTREFIGVGGFNDYIAYEFADLGVVVLESIRLGNAIYVFGNDWETVAQLSKGEIIEGDLHLERIVHRGEWRRKLSRFLARRSAA